MPRVAVVVAIAVLGWLAPPASAQPKVKPAYLKAYSDGQDAYLLGKYKQARKHFERARKIQPELPGAYRMLAAVAERQERYPDCLEQAKKYLQRQTEMNKRVRQTRELHEKCRRALNRPRFTGDYEGGGAISVTSNVEQATVRLNGLKYGATPLPARSVAAGKSEVCLEAARWLKNCADVVILEGIVTDVDIQLEPDPNAPPDPNLVGQNDNVEIGWITFVTATPNTTIEIEGKPIRTDSQGRVEMVPGVYETIATAEGHEPWKRRVRVLRGQNRTITIELRDEDARARYRRLGYYSLGAATVATGAGVLFSMKEQDAREEAQDIYDTELRRRPPALGDPQCDLVECHTRADMEDAIDRAKKWRNASLISFGVATAALGASIYFFIKERPAERQGFELPMAIAPLPDGEGGVAGVAASYTTELDW